MSSLSGSTSSSRCCYVDLTRTVDHSRHLPSCRRAASARSPTCSNVNSHSLCVRCVRLGDRLGVWAGLVGAGGRGGPPPPTGPDRPIGSTGPGASPATPRTRRAQHQPARARGTSGVTGQQPGKSMAAGAPHSGSVRGWRTDGAVFYPSHCSLQLSVWTAQKRTGRVIRFCAYAGLALDEGVRNCRATPGALNSLRAF
jgi:hypothetical protein